MSASRLFLAAFVIGCTPSSPPAVDMAPPAEQPVLAGIPAPRPPTGAFAPSAVLRDTAALKVQATRYVAGPGSKTAVIHRLTTLTVQASRAVERMRAGHTHKGYRPGDVIAARVAADALAAYLQTQALSQ